MLLLGYSNFHKNIAGFVCIKDGASSGNRVSCCSLTVKLCQGTVTVNSEGVLSQLPLGGGCGE